MFAGGFQDARSATAPYYPAKIANGRSAVADGISDSGNPAWSDVDANLAAFQGSAAAQELHRAWNGGGRVPSLSERSTPSTFTDLSRLDLSERGRQTYGYSMGNDVRQTTSGGITRSRSCGRSSESAVLRCFTRTSWHPRAMRGREAHGFASLWSPADERIRPQTIRVRDSRQYRRESAGAHIDCEHADVVRA